MAGNYDPGFDPDHPDPDDPAYGPDPAPEDHGPPAPPPPPAPGSPASFFDAAGKFNGQYEPYFRSLFPGQTTLTGAQLKAKEAELKKAGMTVVTSASGNTAWVNYPGSNGDIDVIGDYGGANTLQWLLPGSGGGAGAGPAIDPSYLAPFTQSFKDFYPGAFGAAGAEFPGAFRAPTADSILQDPSYQWREGRLRGSIENSAAARGLTNSGGTIDDILSNVGNFASQEYGNIWNRDFNLWNTDWQHAGDAYSRAWQQYLDSKNTFYQNQDRPFDKMFKGIETGLRATE